MLPPLKRRGNGLNVCNGVDRYDIRSLVYEVGKGSVIYTIGCIVVGYFILNFICWLIELLSGGGD